MKSFPIYLFLALFLLLGGCGFTEKGLDPPQIPTTEAPTTAPTDSLVKTPPPETKQPNPQTLPPVVVDQAFKDQIENFSNYLPIASTKDRYVIPSCNDWQPFINEVLDGGIKKLVLFTSKTRSLELILTKKPRNMNSEEFKRINECARAGVRLALKAFDDDLLWGYPRCNIGVVPERDTPEFIDYTNCLVIEKQLDAYLRDYP